jgi:hypothetical protein
MICDALILHRSDQTKENKIGGNVASMRGNKSAHKIFGTETCRKEKTWKA